MLYIGIYPTFTSSPLHPQSSNKFKWLCAEKAGVKVHTRSFIVRKKTKHEQQEQTWKKGQRGKSEKYRQVNMIWGGQLTQSHLTLVARGFGRLWSVTLFPLKLGCCEIRSVLPRPPHLTRYSGWWRCGWTPTVLRSYTIAPCLPSHAHLRACKTIWWISS